MTLGPRCMAVLTALMVFAGSAFGMDRIGVRAVDGEGEFVNTATGETFTPRGVNYVDFQSAGYFMQDRALATDVFDPDRIDEAFVLLRQYGYNTVRLFFDLCNEGPACITQKGVPGLNPAYLDNLAHFTRLAAARDIHVLFTSNDIPDHGGYGAVANRDAGDMVDGYRNAHFMTAGGIASFSAYWGDLMDGLNARDMVWEAVLGWSILNEQWIFKDQKPWSLGHGVFVNGTGQSYDLSDPDQKRAALSDNLVAISETVRNIVRDADPDALVTMGFFAPQFPNETGIGGDWYVDTQPLLARAPLDFFDFHAYTDMDIGIAAQAENFGMPHHRDKPVIMGEVGSSPFFIPRVETALRAEQIWMADSCVEGFDGWLHWGYYPFPPGVDQHPPYTFLSHGRKLLVGLSPAVRLDPCSRSNLEPTIDLREGATARASGFLPAHPPANAMDGMETAWQSGAEAPGWIEIELAEPGRLANVGLWLEQYPPGETRTLVTATTADGTAIVVADHVALTSGGERLSFALPGGVPNVTAVRVEIARSPSWISLYEVELLRSSESGRACVLTSGGNVNLRLAATTGAGLAGRLERGQALIGTRRHDGGAGPHWFETHAGTFVRSDVIAASPGCARLGPAEPGDT